MIRDILRPAKRGSEGFPERARDAPKGRSPAGASRASEGNPERASLKGKQNIPNLEPKSA